MGEFFYAQLDNDRKVIGVCSLAGEVIAPNVLRIETLDYTLMGKIHTEDGFINDPNTPLPVILTELEMAINSKVDELDRECNTEINSGFWWNGKLGNRLYGCDETHDQINLEALKNNILFGLILEGTLEYYCKGGECEPWTNAEFLAMYSVAMAFKSERIKTCKAKKALAKVATTVEEVNSIVWIPLQSI